MEKEFASIEENGQRRKLQHTNSKKLVKAVTKKNNSDQNESSVKNLLGLFTSGSEQILAGGAGKFIPQVETSRQEVVIQASALISCSEQILAADIGKVIPQVETPRQEVAVIQASAFISCSEQILAADVGKVIPQVETTRKEVAVIPASALISRSKQIIATDAGKVIPQVKTPSQEVAVIQASASISCSEQIIAADVGKVIPQVETTSKEVAVIPASALLSRSKQIIATDAGKVIPPSQEVPVIKASALISCSEQILVADVGKVIPQVETTRTEVAVVPASVSLSRSEPIIARGLEKVIPQVEIPSQELAVIPASASISRSEPIIARGVKKVIKQVKIPSQEVEVVPASASSKESKVSRQSGLAQQIAALKHNTKKLCTKFDLRQGAALEEDNSSPRSSKLSCESHINSPSNISQEEATPRTIKQRKQITADKRAQKGKEEIQRLSRKELVEQVKELQLQIDYFQELFVKLTSQNPELGQNIEQLMEINPSLRCIKLLPSTSSYVPLDSERLNAGSCNKETRPSKQRHESEMSSASTVTSQRDAMKSNDNFSPSTSEANRRKRGQRKRKNRGNKSTKCKGSELDMLKKYINTIVADYLGTQKKELAAELEFRGTEEDLESYAQNLVQHGLGRIVEEEIRINRKNNRQSFVTMCADREGPERDGIILMPVARRYAFEGDIVRAFVMNSVAKNIGASTSGVATEEIKVSSEEEKIIEGTSNSFLGQDSFAADEIMESPDSDDPNEIDASVVSVPENCPKAFVIKIVKQTELREVVGTISFKNTIKLDDDRLYFKLKPYDMRVPMVYVPIESGLEHITALNNDEIWKLLYSAHIVETDNNGHCIGELEQPVGKVGDLSAEMKAILWNNGLKDIRPYDQKFIDMYAEPHLPINIENLQNHKDLRDKCIFTIDPMTARDLDDAVSIEHISDDVYELGVHISDVSYYLHEDSELDNIVKTRATSIYLVNEVIHMLPPTLCLKCSLLPGEEKLAFTVFWHINTKGHLINGPTFTRSIIKSCVQLAYEHAQKIIENPNDEFSAHNFPTIYNGFTVKDICSRIRLLNKIADELRKERFNNGALSINNPKLRIHLHPKTNEPIQYAVEERLEANFLIEEYMLLANQAVARFIFERFPNIAILRHHAPPLAKSMKNLKEKLNNLGMEFDCSSSKAVFESMQRLCQQSSDPRAMDACLSQLLTKPMARAKYFCSEGKQEEGDLWHYALSIPIYTHFTSPIRRYPDILVHRLLAAACSYNEQPKRTSEELHMLAKICNEQKYNAKNAGDDSINLFFKRFVKEKQSITLRSVVTDIYQHMLNVVTIETGHTICIQYKMQKVLIDSSNAPAYILIAEKNSKNAPIKLEVFSTVDVKLVIWNEKLSGYFASPDPKQRHLNSIEGSKKGKQKGSGSGAYNESGSGKRRTLQRNATESTESQTSEVPNLVNNAADETTVNPTATKPTNTLTTSTSAADNSQHS